jgi:hypothetical protein
VWQSFETIAHSLAGMPSTCCAGRVYWLDAHAELSRRTPNLHDPNQTNNYFVFTKSDRNNGNVTRIRRLAGETEIQSLTSSPIRGEVNESCKEAFP